MSFTSSGAAITLGGTAVYPAISTANGAGVGGAIVVGTKLTVGSLTATGTSTGGTITLGREVVAGAILTNGAAGGAVTLGDECTVTTITSKPLVAPNGGGLITIADDCSTGNIDTSGTVAGTMGGVMSIGDRCECGSISSLGSAGGAAVTVGEGCLFTGVVDCRSTATGSGGAFTSSHRLVISAGLGSVLLTNGDVNSGNISVGLNAFISGIIESTANTGNSGTVALGDGSNFGGLTHDSTSGNTGNVQLGKFCRLGAITMIATAGNSGTVSIGDGCTIAGLITKNCLNVSGAVTIGNAVTVGGDLDSHSVNGPTGPIIVGNGCNVQNLRNLTNVAGNAGGITIGSATNALACQSSTGGGAGVTGGNIIIGSGSNVRDCYSGSTGAGSNSGSIVMEPGSTAQYLDSHSTTGIGGNITLKNSNVVNAVFTVAIALGTSNPGILISINSKITDQIDNITGGAIFRDLIGSTQAANRDFIANVTANGAQFTNCLIVPNGTGFSIQAAAPRTVIAYQFLQKNPFPANITLSEGSETTSVNLAAP